MTREDALEAQLGEALDRIRALEREANIRDEAVRILRADLDHANRALSEIRAVARRHGVPL